MLRAMLHTTNVITWCRVRMRALTQGLKESEYGKFEYICFEGSVYV